MLNNGPAKYCKKHSSTPAIPTEDIRRSSYGPPIEAAVETTSKPGIVKTIYATFFKVNYSPVVVFLAVVLAYTIWRGWAYARASVNAFHEVDFFKSLR